ncbi:MAG: thioester domain-containing protein [Clostridia bacterium]
MKSSLGVDENGDYTVSITELLSDVRIWRTIINGFPYKSANDLGVANDLDAYVATKQAVYSILYDRDVRSFYHGGDYRGELIVNAMDNMVWQGRYGNQTPASANLSINKIGNLQEEPAYYSQEYRVSSTVRLDRYDVISTVGLPEGAYIADVNGINKTNFSGVEHFKVMIPKGKMVADISSLIFVQAKCETYPIFYR